MAEQQLAKAISDAKPYPCVFEAQFVAAAMAGATQFTALQTAPFAFLTRRRFCIQFASYAKTYEAPEEEEEEEEEKSQMHAHHRSAFEEAGPLSVSGSDAAQVDLCGGPSLLVEGAGHKHRCGIA
jgi:hypothetical protein